MLSYLSTAQRIQALVVWAISENLKRKTATNCLHPSGRWSRIYWSIFKSIFHFVIWMDFFWSTSKHYTFLFFFLQICGQGKHGNCKRYSVIKGELAWSQQAQEPNEKVEGWPTTTRGNSIAMDQHHGLEVSWKAGAQDHSFETCQEFVDPEVEGWRKKETVDHTVDQQNLTFEDWQLPKTCGSWTLLEFFSKLNNSLYAKQGSFKAKDMGVDFRSSVQLHQQRYQ